MPGCNLACNADSTSARRMTPPGPVGVSAAQLIPLSRASFRTTGEMTLGAAVGATTGCAAFAGVTTPVLPAAELPPAVTLRRPLCLASEVP